jgi:hypothetical protein
MKDQSSAKDYMQKKSAEVRRGDYWNCLLVAQEVASLLLAEGFTPWIARLRKTEVSSGHVFHAPLIPRVPGLSPTWTTHYVCCCEGMAYDPLAGRPLSLDSYTLEIFGEELPLEAVDT